MTDISDGPHTLGRWLRDRAAASPQRIAIDDRGVEVDYADLHRRAAGLAGRLTLSGYGAGHRVATVSGNTVDHVVAFFACAMIGAALVPLSWRLTPIELAPLLRRSGAVLVLVEDEHAALAGAALGLIETGRPVSAELGATGIEARVPACVTPRPARAVRDDDPLLVIFTSGSEAAPKGVVLTHANCFWNNLALGQAMPLRADDVVLAMLPQYHVAAWNVQPLLAWWTGATVVLERSFHPSRVLSLIRDRRVTTMMGVPTQYRMLMDAPEWRSTDISSLRLALVGGATIPADIAEAWAARGVPLTQGYGLTEAGPNVLWLPATERKSGRGMVGRPYPSVDVRLMDPATGLELRGPATGELWVRGPAVFAGYLDDPTATERARSGEWLRTGDLAERDADGCYRIVDRLKEIFVSGGENVAPAEVEQVLSGHPLVTAAAVVGTPDPVWGERGVAFVVAHGPVSTDELMAYGRERLAAFKLPARIVFLENLPRSTIDKVARAALRALAEQTEAQNHKESVDDEPR